MNTNHHNEVLQRKTKKSRRSLNLAQKLQIVERLDKGEKPGDVCRSLNLAFSTVRSIYLRKNKLNNASSSKLLQYSTRSREFVFEELEKRLLLWMNANGGVHFPYSVVQQKALTLFDVVREEAIREGRPISETDFKASAGWYGRFLKRANLKSKKNEEKPSIEFVEASEEYTETSPVRSSSPESMIKIEIDEMCFPSYENTPNASNQYNECSSSVELRQHESCAPEEVASHSAPPTADEKESDESCDIFGRMVGDSIKLIKKQQLRTLLKHKIMLEIISHQQKDME